MNLVAKISTVCIGVLLACLMPSVVSADEVVGGDRPVTIEVPASYDPAVPTPLIIALHGRNNLVEDVVGELWGFRAIAEELGLLFAMPRGTFEPDNGQYSWNATDVCCTPLVVDESTYLRSVIDEAIAHPDLNVDEQRVYVLGHSAGAFMSHRMACDHGDAIAAIASIEGATYKEKDDCAAANAVHILEVHGDQDDGIEYDGGSTPGGVYPGAVETVENWRQLNGCNSGFVEPIEGRDITPSPGAETQPRLYRSGCAPGGDVELWTIEGGEHRPGVKPDGVTSALAAQVTQWLLDHPKPPAPIAKFTVSMGADPLTRDFDAAASSTRVGTNIDAYEWDFGDGATAEGVAVAHTFAIPGFHTVTLTTRTSDGGRFGRARETIFVPVPAGDTAPWTTADIGDPGTTGAVSVSGADLICFGRGKALGGNSDNFHFFHQEIVGDTTLTARIESTSPVNATSSVGLMLRASVAANSRFAGILIAQTGSTHHTDFVRRTVSIAGKTSSEDLPDRWVRIERQGDLFIGSSSDDGVNWTERGNRTIALPETILGGIALTLVDATTPVDTVDAVVFANVKDLVITEPPPDCNENGIADDVDIASGAETDCNANDIPDSCDITEATSTDLNANLLPDECEDCNENGNPDDLDLADSVSEDLNGNGLPDECDPDCNGNGAPDDLDISGGASQDANGDSFPDECALFLRADANGDGRVNIADPSFIANAIFISGADQPECDMAADANGDGRINIADPSFVANSLFLAGALEPPPPFPACGAEPEALGLTCVTQPLDCVSP